MVSNYYEMIKSMIGN